VQGAVPQEGLLPFKVPQRSDRRACEFPLGGSVEKCMPHRFSLTVGQEHDSTSSEKYKASCSGSSRSGQQSNHQAAIHRTARA